MFTFLKKLDLLTIVLKVLVPKNPTFMGKMVQVDIYESGKHFMKGQPVSDAEVYAPSIRRPLAKGQVSGLTEVSEKDAFLPAPPGERQLWRHRAPRPRFCYHL